jgi:G3E family GTPase
VDHLQASTLLVPLAKTITRSQLDAFLKALPAAVYRAKGFVRLAEKPDLLHTVQKVRDQAELLLLPLETNPADGPLKTGLILIGPHLPASDIQALAARLL